MITLLVKFKWYLVAFGVLCLMAFTIWLNVILKQNKTYKLENARLNSNQVVLLARASNYEKLVLTYREAEKQNLIRFDSLAKLLKIKPKEITKIVEKTIVQTDTVDHLIPVDVIGKDTWLISDKDKCFEWSGVARLKDDSLNVTRTLFNYHNKTDDVFWEHRKYKFLGIRFGKKQTFQQTVSECGNAQTIEISILKK